MAAIGSVWKKVNGNDYMIEREVISLSKMSKNF